jgi:hypothetical protein
MSSPSALLASKISQGVRGIGRSATRIERASRRRATSSAFFSSHVFPATFDSSDFPPRALLASRSLGCLCFPALLRLKARLPRSSRSVLFLCPSFFLLPPSPLISIVSLSLTLSPSRIVLSVPPADWRSVLSVVHRNFPLRFRPSRPSLRLRSTPQLQLLPQVVCELDISLSTPLLARSRTLQGTRNLRRFRQRGRERRRRVARLGIAPRAQRRSARSRYP